MRGITVIFRVIACLAAAFMLLTLPLSPAHQPTNHFRAPQLRSFVQRHSVLEETRSDVSDRLALEQRQPSPILTVEEQTAAIPSGEFHSTPEVPISLLLLRLKLGPASSGGLEPHLQT